MRTAPLFIATTALGFLFAACSVTTTDTNDSGTPTPDGGQGNDTGTNPDGGQGNDTGTSPDGGGTDTGTTTDGGGATTWPVITSQGGATMAPMKLVTIVAGNDGDSTALFAFGDAVQNSQWWASFKDDYGLGAFGGHTKWTGANITGATISDVQMIAYIQATITANGGAAPDSHTLYLLYLPDGTNSSDSTSGEVNTDCASSSGYHTITSTGMIWGVVERCPVSYAGWTKLMGVTQTAAHEIGEAATDPDVSTGWFLTCPAGKNPWECSPFAIATQGEVGDLCPETRWDEAGYTWSRIWSKSAAAAGNDPCMPARSEAFYNVQAPQGWYTVTAGQSVTIPLTAYATGSSPDFNLTSGLGKVKQGVTGWTQALAAQTVSVGASVNLTVTAPAGAASGDWITVYLGSSPGTLGTLDPVHQYYVGVHVP